MRWLWNVCSTSIQISIVSKLIDSWRTTQHQCIALSFMWKWSCNSLSFVFLIVAAHNYGYLIIHTRNGTVFNLRLINDRLVLTSRKSFIHTICCVCQAFTNTFDLFKNESISKGNWPKLWLFIFTNVSNPG